MKIILASSSPRRKELLRLLVNDFRVIASHTKEKIEPLAPWTLVKKLAFQKAQKVFEKLARKNNILVIAADTLVTFKNRGNWQIIGKAKNKSGAKKILRLLSDNKHYVYTGVCFLSKEKRKIVLEKSKVEFRFITDQEIDDYLGSANWQDKAGAYAIQEEGGDFVKYYKGSLTNIWGLPLEKLSQELQALGIKINRHWSKVARAFMKNRINNGDDHSDRCC